MLTPASWPWAQWLAWAAASALLVAGAAAWRRGRAEALRQREQARVAAMERLGTLGEMAAGIAHELNQPLTAILAQTRAAERMLDDEDERPAVREALRASAGQAAARPTSSPACARWCAQRARRARGAGSRGAGEFAALPARAGAGAPGRAPGVAQRRPGERPLGDRVALEQILHNLVQNAVDALAGMRAAPPARG